MARRKVHTDPNKAAGRLGKFTLITVALCLGFALIGLFSIETGINSGTSIHDNDRPAASLTQATLPPMNQATTDDAAYLGHLHTNGIDPSGTPGAAWSALDRETLVNVGHSACRLLEIQPKSSIADAIDATDSFVHNRLASALIVDAAVSHLCKGVDR